MVLLDPVEYADPPNVPTPIPVVAPEVHKEGVGEIPTDASIQMPGNRNKPPQSVS